MGIPVRLEADREPLLGAAMAAFQAWSAPARTASGGALTLRLRTGAPGPRADDVGEVVVERHLLRLAGAGLDGWADARTREAACTIPLELIGDPARLAAEALDTLVLFLLTRSGRLPLHAAGILLGDTAILLAGPSGSGKSTLALTAARAGITILSEDTAYLQLQPHFRVWGSPRPIHLLPEEGRSDAGGTALRHRNGRWKIALPISTAGQYVPTAARAALCLLQRGARVELRPMEPTLAADRVMSSLDPGFDHFRRELPAALSALTADGAWTLTLTEDPCAAIVALRERFGE